MEYKIVKCSPDKLIHWGIKGQKWGVRRFENEDGTLTPEGKNRYNKNYREDQRKRDEAVYSKGAVKRINRHMNEGYNVSGARSLEAQRIDKARDRARVAATTGAVAGGIAGLFAPELITLGARAMQRNGIAPGVADMLLQGMSNPKIRIATSIGSAFVAPRLGSKIGSSATMRIHGYKGSKYNNATGLEVSDSLVGVMGGGY